MQSTWDGPHMREPARVQTPTTLRHLSRHYFSFGQQLTLNKRCKSRLPHGPCCAALTCRVFQCRSSLQLHGDGSRQGKGQRARRNLGSRESPSLLGVVSHGSLNFLVHNLLVANTPPSHSLLLSLLGVRRGMCSLWKSTCHGRLSHLPTKADAIPLPCAFYIPLQILQSGAFGPP